MFKVMLHKILIGLILYCLVLISITQAKTENHEYCVVGAGPGGLQIAYYLQDAGRDYVVFEKNELAGSFFTYYPRHRKLLSVNKVNTGRTSSEFNLRHDWNSLLSKNQTFRMSQYSQDYYPQADDLVEYLNGYANEFKLNIKYEIDIVSITRDSDADDAKFKFMDQNSDVYICKVAIISTGMAYPYVPFGFAGNSVIEHYETVSVNPNDFKGQNILILGMGNSGFETAQALSHTANFIHILGKSRVRLASETHYIGDVRAVNTRHIDSYQLKTLDGIFEGDLRHAIVVKMPDNTYQVGVHKGSSYVRNDHSARHNYHRVIRCLGFQYDDSIFGENATPSKSHFIPERYPQIMGNYESINVPNMFFAGAIAHSLDYRKSGGGSIQGFRYTARALHRILEWRYHKNPWPATTFRINALIDHIITRINQASGLYQMFGSLVDVILIHKRNRFEYLQEVPIDLLLKFEELTGRKIDRGFLTLTFQYGKNYSKPGADTLNKNNFVHFADKCNECKHIHPVISYYKNPFQGLDKDRELPLPDKLFHVLEDVLAEWHLPENHVYPIKVFLENIFNKDLNNYFADSCFEMALKYKNIPTACSRPNIQRRGNEKVNKKDKPTEVKKDNSTSSTV